MNSENTIENFEKIIEECSEQNTKYNDTEFYPQKKLIDEDNKLLYGCEWYRIEDQYTTNLFNNISPESICQGDISDCNVVASLIYIAHHKELVKSLFHPRSSLKYGCVLVYLYYLGQKIPIIVDTQIPYSNSNSKYPLFCQPRTNDDSCWFVLVEKAYAKAYGGYSLIKEGLTHFTTHVLTDFYSAYFNKIIDIIPSKSLDEEKIKQSTNIANDRVFQILSDLKKKNAMISTAIEEEKSGNFDKSTGLISDHSYLILDVREIKRKYYIKLRNPCGDHKTRFIKLTEDLKKDLSYSEEDENNGSFWMLLENYFHYFNTISYSLQKEPYWKEMNVYGQIEGYLDGRSPTSNSPFVGCIPQWSIKFSQKTIVRLTFNVSGPESFHGIYICKNHGHKVNTLSLSTEIMRSVTNSMVNGIEYIVDDFSEPFTFFFTREKAMDEPCYYRILIQSPDTNFIITKFNDDFIKENWNSVSYTRFFSSSDYWDPFKSQPLTTCRQWFVRFPNMIKNKEGELRFRIFKKANEGPLHLFFARTGKKISYSYMNHFYNYYKICSSTEYEEVSIPVSFKDFYKTKDIFEYNETDSVDYVFAFYRTKDSNIDSFKFTVLCESMFQIGVMPEPDPINNCGYQIKSVFQNSDETEQTKKWRLVFPKELTTIFVEFLCDNPSKTHKISLNEMQNTNKNISFFENDRAQFDFNIDQNCLRNQVIWKIDKIENPYELTVSGVKSDYTLNVFGTKNFEMYQNDGSGNETAVPKIDKTKFIDYTKLHLKFPEVTFIRQPNDFHPTKKEKQHIKQSSTSYQPNENLYYYDYASDSHQPYKDKENISQNTNGNSNSYNRDANDKIPQKRRVEDFQKENDVNINDNKQINRNENTNLQSENSFYYYYYSSDYDEESVYSNNQKTSQFSYYTYTNNYTEPKDDENEIQTNQEDQEQTQIPNVNDQEPNSKSVHQEISNINESNIDTNNNNVVFYNKNETERMIDLAKCYLFSKDTQYLDISLISIFGKKHIYALIGFSVLILKQKFFTKKLTKKQKIKFTSISKISLPTTKNNVIEIYYNQNSKVLSFQAENPSEIIEKLINQIFRTLTLFEINKITFENINLPALLPEITSPSISSRLNSKSLKKFHDHNEYLKLFLQVLFSHSNSFFLTKVKKMKKLFPFLLPCILLDRNIKQIDIVDPRSVFPFVIKNIECFSNINHIKIKGGDTKELQQIINQIPNINSLSFHDFQIKKFEFIPDLINNHKIESMGFDSALSEDAFLEFIQNPCFGNLKYFRVSNLPKNNISSCIGSFKQLSFLSLTYCNLEIIEMLQLIELNQLKSLQQLDLSGNIASDKANNQSYSILPNLKLLHVNNVKWELNQLKYFLNACANSNLISLSVDKINFIDTSSINNKWNSFFTNLPNQMNSITSISWDSNEITRQFITFLINSLSLTEISFNFCKSSNLDEVKRILIQDNRIKKINLQQISFENKEIYYEHFKNFLLAIPHMRSLNQIDLSHNHFDDQSLEILSDSVINSNINFLSIDDSNVTSFADLLGFYKKIKANKQMSIDISYPILDIERLNLKQNEITVLNQCFNKLKNPLSNRETCSYDPLQEVSYLRLNKPFPQFLPNENEIKSVLTSESISKSKHDQESVSTSHKSNYNNQTLNQENSDANPKHQIVNEKNKNVDGSYKNLNAKNQMLNESHKNLNKQNQNPNENHKNLNAKNQNPNESHKNLNEQNPNPNENHKKLNVKNQISNENNKNLNKKNQMSNEDHKNLNEQNQKLNEKHHVFNEENVNKITNENNQEDNIIIHDENESDSYYYYYTETENNEVNQTQSPITHKKENIQNGNTTNVDSKPSIISKPNYRRQNSSFMDENANNSINKNDNLNFNPYYQYVSKISNQNSTYNRNYMKNKETENLQNTFYYRNVFQKNKFSLISLSSSNSNSDISGSDSQDDIFHLFP